MNDNNPVLADPGSNPTPHSPMHHELPLRFVGSGSEYFRIWIVNLLLTLVTLGLYYPFAKARRLRYFHGATEVGGAALSFHANPWKMLYGYALVVVMMLAYGAAGQYSPVAGVIALVIVAALWPALWHSSMRFRLANTGWRGLRFAFTGRRRQAYVAMAIPAGLVLGLVVLGAVLQPDELADPQASNTPLKPPTGSAVFFALLPTMLIAALLPMFFWLLKRMQHAHLALGPERTAFAAGMGSFYGLALKSFGVGMAVGLLVPGVLLAVGFMTGSISSAMGSVLALGAMGLVLMYALVLPIVGGYWTAKLQNLVWNATTSQHLRFSSQLRARSLAGLWLKNTWLVLLTLGLYFPFAQVASARMRLQALTVLSSINPDELVATAGRADEAAAGDAAGDLLGFDIGL